MARTKGSKNKQSPITAATLDLTLEERIRLIANLVVDTLETRKRAESVIAREFSDA